MVDGVVGSDSRRDEEQEGSRGSEFHARHHCGNPVRQIWTREVDEGMASESVQVEERAVNQIAQERSMARLTKILRENGVEVFQWQPCSICATEGCYHPGRPTIWFSGDDNEGRRAVEIGMQHDFPTIRIARQWVVDEEGIVEESECWAMMFPHFERLSGPTCSRGKASTHAHQES